MYVPKRLQLGLQTSGPGVLCGVAKLWAWRLERSSPFSKGSVMVQLQSCCVHCLLGPQKTMQVFNAGRSHLHYYLALRLAPWCQFPWHVFGMASANVTIGKAFAEPRPLLRSPTSPPKNKQSCLQLHQPLVRFANILLEAPTSSQKPSEFGIASQIVKAVLQKALHSGCKRSLVTALQVEPLHSQAREWLEYSCKLQAFHVSSSGF